MYLLTNKIFDLCPVVEKEKDTRSQRTKEKNA